KNDYDRALSVPASMHPVDIRVLVIDGHALFVEGIRTLIENEPGMSFVGYAANRTEALTMAALQPNIIILEAILQGSSTLDFIPDLLQIAQGSRVLILTGDTDPNIQLGAMRQGAKGALLKRESSSELFTAIRKLHQGEVWLSRTAAGSVRWLGGAAIKPNP